MVSQGRGFCLYITFSLGPDALVLNSRKSLPLGSYPALSQDLLGVLKEGKI